MSETNHLVFLDTETTGLDPDLHEVWEIAYAVDDQPVVSAVVPHDIVTGDPTALRLNGYWSRRLQVHETSADFDQTIRQVLPGATLVGANPAFDAAFLRARWGVAPWHYRMIDVESMAMQAFRWDRPKGLLSIAEALAYEGHNVPAPDHTAAGDVATLRAVYRALRTFGGTS